MVEPVLIAVATALASKAAAGLYDLVRTKLAESKEQTAILDSAAGAEPGSPPVLRLAEILERAEQTDPEFGVRLRGEWVKISTADSRGDTANEITGTVSGNAVQARDIQGGITF